MTNWKLQGLRGDTRRRFLKLMGIAASAMGLERANLLNYLADRGGHGLADAAVSKANRALLITNGNGVYAWWQELWPHWELGARYANTTFNADAYLYRANYGYTGNPGVLYDTAQGADKPLYYAPTAPWFDFNAGLPTRPMTAIMAGRDETHTSFPITANKVSGGATMTAAIGAVQAASNTTALVPALGIDPLEFGDATGAPDIVTVPSAEGMVGVFNSAASQFVLSTVEDQKLFETYYNALVGLRRSAPRSAWQPQLKIAKGAAKLIGLNFASALTPTANDLTAYGIDATTMGAANLTATQRMGLENFGRTLIVTARAFRQGLTNMAMIALSPGPTSDTSWTDPHVTFANATTMAQGRETTEKLSQIMQAFYDDLAQYDDPDFGSETKLSETTVTAIWGDTPHTPLQGSAWPDATPQSCNWLYLLSQGYIKNGWFGRVTSTTSSPSSAQVYGFDPVTGDEVMNKAAELTSTAAGAAVLYAITRGDWNTVAEYYPGAKIEGMLKA